MVKTRGWKSSFPARSQAGGRPLWGGLRRPVRPEERAPALTAYPTVTEGRPPPSPHRVRRPPSPAPSTPPHEAVVATFELLYLVRKALALQKQSRSRVLSGRPALSRGAEGRSPIWEGAKAGGASEARGRYNRAGPRRAYRLVGKEAWGHSLGRELGAEASPFHSINSPFRSLCGAGIPRGPSRGPVLAPSPGHSFSVGPGPDAPRGRVGMEGPERARAPEGRSEPLASRSQLAAQGTARASKRGRGVVQWCPHLRPWPTSSVPHLPAPPNWKGPLLSPYASIPSRLCTCFLPPCELGLELPFAAVLCPGTRLGPSCGVWTGSRTHVQPDFSSGRAPGQRSCPHPLLPLPRPSSLWLGVLSLG